MNQKIRQDESIGQNLRKLRYQKELSQEKLCAELQQRGYDIGRSTYAKYESGKLNIPMGLLRTLRNYYQCDYADFFDIK
ncbi:MAG: helix-turn-helix domain-containing protein [Oscillospiraceae bacterium]|nr:helix-turn-helix domain-containing protein [Oscillospiraceae bacterium]